MPQQPYRRTTIYPRRPDAAEKARASDDAAACLAIGRAVLEARERHPDAVRVEVYGPPGKERVRAVMDADG